MVQKHSRERTIYHHEQRMHRTLAKKGFTSLAIREGRRLADLRDRATSTDEWTYAAYKVGYRLGSTNNWEDLKSLLTYLRDWADEQGIAKHVQKGAQTGAHATREGHHDRDPRRKKRKGLKGAWKKFYDHHAAMVRAAKEGDQEAAAYLTLQRERLRALTKGKRKLGRDPKKRAKRGMKRNHPMAPYFAWVKKNHKKFQKPNGQLDMKRMWRFWKTHHAA